MWLNHYNKHTDSSDVFMGVFSVTLWTSHIKCWGHIEVMEYKTDTPVTQHTKDPEEKCVFIQLRWTSRRRVTWCVFWRQRTHDLLTETFQMKPQWMTCDVRLTDNKTIPLKEERNSSFDCWPLPVPCVFTNEGRVLYLYCCSNETKRSFLSRPQTRPLRRPLKMSACFQGSWTQMKGWRCLRGTRGRSYSCMRRSLSWRGRSIWWASAHVCRAPWRNFSSPSQRQAQRYGKHRGTNLIHHYWLLISALTFIITFIYNHSSVSLLNWWFTVAQVSQNSTY